MTQTIIILHGSPEVESNSSTMAHEFAQAILKESPSTLIEHVYLRDIPFEYYSYKAKTPLESETEFKTLTDKIQRADALVIATPAYNFSVPAKLKNFIDRIGFFALDYTKKTKLGQPRPQLQYLRTFFLVSGGTPCAMKKCLFFLFPDFWLWAIFQYYGAKTYGSLYGGNLSYTTPAKKDLDLLKKCQECGKSFIRKVEKNIKSKKEQKSEK